MNLECLYLFLHVWLNISTLYFCYASACPTAHPVDGLQEIFCCLSIAVRVRVCSGRGILLPVFRQHLFLTQLQSFRGGSISIRTLHPDPTTFEVRWVQPISGPDQVVSRSEISNRIKIITSQLTLSPGPLAALARLPS